MPHKDRQEYLKYHKEYTAKNKERKRPIKQRSSLMYKFNITMEMYEQMLMDQDFRCGICKKHMSEFTRRFAVDHCHETGKIRGLLCMKCNIGLGNLGDTEKSLEQAMAYLKIANQGP